MSNGVKARDGYERYYSEKLWQLVPELYRNEDVTGAFRQIVELIGEQAAESRRSIDRLWEDQHIETCDDWAVPYIGELVGARLVSAQDRRARRVDVGNTIRFRRRRGTPELLDTLVRAMSGWDIVLEEGFRRLARTRHRLDPPPVDHGLFTATLSGGTADLRNPAGAELADSPFTEYFHTLDTRRLRGRDGRFGVRKLNFHVYRLRAFEMTGVDPVELTDPDGLGILRTYTMDPSGRDIPLFVSGGGAGTEDHGPVCVDPSEWQISQPMRCRLLGHVGYRIANSHILELQTLSNPPSGADLVALGRARGTLFHSEPALRRRLRDFGAGIAANPPDWYVALVALSLVDETGKAQLYPRQVSVSDGGADIPPERVSAANLADLLCHPDPAGPLERLIISPELGRFASAPPDEPADFEPLVERYHYGFAAQLGAGPYPRASITIAPSRTAADGTVPDGGELQGDGLLISDNRSYELTIRTGQPPDEPAALAVGPQRRPFVRLRGEAGSLTTPTLTPAAAGQTFLIDGGWYAGQDPDSELGSGETFDLVIEGAAANTENTFDFERIEIQYATLDPGGLRADGVVIPPLRLFVHARVKTLLIRRSVVGPIHVERDNADDPSVIDELIICDSIVDASRTASKVAISNLFGRVSLESSTVFGDLRAAVLHASDSIVDGRIRVVNNQAGCFRFSATRDGSGVRLPPRYRDYVGPLPPALFHSKRFGDPHYAQLSLVAPKAISEGAENGSEMGAFSHLRNPIRLRSVRGKVDEFGPAGQLAQYLFAGDRKAEAAFFADVLSPEPPVLDPPAPPEPDEVIPEPEPPPPPPLPTRCDDEEPEPEPEPDPDPDPDPQPPPVAEVVEIPLLGADINGAPDFWRGVDRLPAANEAIDPAAPALPGIPLDKVDFLLEYDARSGGRPEDFGWQPSSTQTPSFYELDGEILRFRVRAQAPAFYSAEAPTGRSAPGQIHAYAVAMLREAPAGARDEAGVSFDLQVALGAPRRPPVGLRAGWGRDTTGSLFHYRSLDGADRFAPTTKQPHDRMLNTWMGVSLQGDVAADRALLSFAGTIDHLPLSWFRTLPGGAGAGRLQALFGFTRDSGQAEGALRNFVVSGPGRFLRVWLRSVAPSNDPTLRLSFVVDGAAEGTARLSVRYADDPDRRAAAVPGARVDRTLALTASDAERVVTVDFPLEKVRQGRHLLLTVERDWTHEEDKLRTSPRLVAARLLARTRLIARRGDQR